MPPIQKSAAVSQPPHPYTDRTGVNLEQPIAYCYRSADICRGMDADQVKTQVTIHDMIIDFCLTPHSKAEIAEHCGYKNTKNFTQKYLRPLLDSGVLKMTIPDKPRSRNQKYITVHSE